MPLTIRNFRRAAPGPWTLVAGQDGKPPRWVRLMTTQDGEQVAVQQRPYSSAAAAA